MSSGWDSTSIRNENCLKSLFTKKLSNRVKLIEFEAKPPNALYNDAGKFFVLKTTEVITSQAMALKEMPMVFIELLEELMMF